MSPYELSKKFINAKVLSKEEMTKRIDTFYMFGRMSQSEYEELMTLIDVKYTA